MTSDSYKAKNRHDKALLFGKAILLNLIVIVILFMLFEPTLKSDDYYMSQICYGTFSGIYDYHLVYSNAILGYIICGLLRVFPNIAWYTVVQLLCLFCCFGVVSYIWMKCLGRVSSLLVAFLFMFGYHFYIRLTFTKTAGLLVATGLLAAYYTVWGCERIGVWGIILSILCILFGVVFRSNMFWGIAAPFCSVLLIYLFGIYKCEYKKKYFIKILLFGGTLIIAIIGRSLLNRYNAYEYSKSYEWQNYLEDNKNKGRLIDYTTNNYEKYQEEYDALGVSKNDLKMMYNNDLYYDGIWSEEKTKSIVEIAAKDNLSTDYWKEFFSATNWAVFLKTLFLSGKNYSFYIFGAFIVGIHLIWAAKKKLLFILIPTLTFIIEQYYLFIGGRNWQEHVDVSLVFSLLVCICFCGGIIDFESIMGLRKTRFSIEVILLTLILSFYGLLTRTAYNTYGSRNACNPSLAKSEIECIVEDKQHLYVTSSIETVYSLWAFGGLEVQPKSYFSNVFAMGTYLWPSHRSVLDTYNVTSPLYEMLDSDVIRFFINNERLDIVNLFEKYIQEHVDENAKMVRVKKTDGISIYKVVTNQFI